ncbi:MAG: murein biosynthesis integral membrane protein MurJ [Succinivibrio sp.]
MTTKKKSVLLRSGAISAVATFLSRILGMIRDIAIASLLGASLSADVFFFANRIPNFFRRLFAEGAFSQAFVPVMSKTRNDNPDDLENLLNRTAGTLGFIVLVITLVGMFASPVLTAIFGWGWFEAYLNDSEDSRKFIEASFLLKITFPYLFFITLTALCSAVLNVYGKFLIPSITPCILNISLICAAYFIAPSFSDPNEILAYAMVVGGILQLALQIPFLLKIKIFIKPKWGWSHPGVKKIRTLMIPAIVGISASQINLIVNTALASFLATGAISYLYYSDRLLEFPIGIFAVAISTVILPTLSRIDITKDKEKFVKTLDWGVRMVLLLGIGSMCGIIALREPILRVIFMRGQFTADHVLLSSASLLASVSGLCAIMLVRVMVQGFAAIQDTKTPVKCSVTAIISNIAFNLILVWPLGYVGLALSTALAAYVNISLLIFFLYKRKIYTISADTAIFAVKLMISGATMCIALRSFIPSFESWVNMTTVQAIFSLGIAIVSGALVFALMCLVLRIKPSVFRM